MVIIRWGRGLAAAYGPVLIGTLLLLAVLAANGQPSVFQDTQEYYGSANSIFHNLLHRDQIGVLRNTAGEVVPRSAAADPRTVAAESGRILSRPIFYGLLLFPLHKLGTLWLMAAVQAALAAYVVLVLWRSVLPTAPIYNYYGLMGLLAAVTPLAFFSGFAMPDIFAFIGAVAAAAALFCWDRLRPLDRVGVWVALFASLLFHTSHLMSGVLWIALGVGLLASAGASPRVTAIRVSPIVFALVAAMLCNLAFNLVWRAEHGLKPLRPPFLAARILADGPGRLYLREACGRGEDWALCRFKDLPLDDNHAILFSKDPAFGVANVADVEALERIDREELRFVVAAILHRPFHQVMASLRNTALQLVTFGPGGTLISPVKMLSNRVGQRVGLSTLVPNAEHCRVKDDCGPRLPAQVWHVIHIVGLVGAVGFLAWRLSGADAAPLFLRRERNSYGGHRAVTVSLFFVVVLIANAAICGAMSAPASRYQSRMIAVAPLAAWLCGTALGLRRPSRRRQVAADALAGKTA